MHSTDYFSSTIIKNKSDIGLSMKDSSRTAIVLMRIVPITIKTSTDLN